LRVPGSEPYRTLLVPELAVQTDQNQKFVLTVDAQNTVRVTPITIGAQFGLLRAVTKGLNGDEHVIVNGLLKARPGSKVQPTAGPIPGIDEALITGRLSTTRVVKPDAALDAATRPTTAPTTAPATQPVAIGIPTAAAGEVAR
jgi:hypothetical protein